MSRRYLRQMVLPEISRHGQDAIGRTSIICVGAGGLGSPVLQYLAAAGVGRISIVDSDLIEETNLHRQVLFGTSDLSKPKVEVAAHRLKELNPEIEIQAYPERLCAANALDLLKGHDIIIDGTDNFAAKYLINDAAVKLRLPVVYGAISGFEGQVCLFWAKHGPCYRCLHPNPPSTYIPNCAENGVLGAVAGIIGSFQASEALQLAVSMNSSRTRECGRLFVVDARTLEASSYLVARSATCPTCSVEPESIVLLDGVSNCELKSSTKFIDVREYDEWRESHIPTALNWPLSRLESGELPECDHQARYVLYCQSGYRSRTAVRIMKSHGFVNCVELDGGITAWTGAKVAKSCPDI